MRFVVQIVHHASVEVNRKIVGEIDKGLLIFIGIAPTDTEEMLHKFVDKIIKMRIFADGQGKTNLALTDINGALLVVSQFTLYADCKKGNRPNFIKAAPPDFANKLYEKFISLCRDQVSIVQTGIFGADMNVKLENDGPFTVIIDSDDF